MSISSDCGSNDKRFSSESRDSVNRSTTLRRGRPWIAVALALGALVALFSANLAPAWAQATDATISDVDCAGDPEVITILNGAETTDFTGWSLVSDPVAEESFDLTAVGELAAGGSVNVQAGPGASGSLVWSQDEVLRDDDASDFARLLDDTGATVDEVACADATPAPTAAPTPTPGDVPDGGGPLAPSSEPLTVLVFTGAGLSAAALLFVAFTLAPMAALRSLIPGRRRAGESSDSGADDTGQPLAAAMSGRALLLAGLGLALLLLLVTVAVGTRTRK